VRASSSQRQHAFELVGLTSPPAWPVPRRQCSCPLLLSFSAVVRCSSCSCLVSVAPHLTATPPPWAPGRRGFDRSALQRREEGKNGSNAPSRQLHPSPAHAPAVLCWRTVRRPVTANKGNNSRGNSRHGKGKSRQLNRREELARHCTDIARSFPTFLLVYREHCALAAIGLPVCPARHAA
jgi:hypothetical protein